MPHLDSAGHILVSVSGALAEFIKAAFPARVRARCIREALWPKSASTRKASGRRRKKHGPQLVEQVMVGQQPGQLTRSVVAGSGALAQLLDAVTVSQPAGQPQLRHVVPGIGQRTDDLDGLLQPGPVR